MNIFDRVLSSIGLVRQKFINYPTITGGIDVLAQYLGNWSNWSKTKLLQAYEKSLYVHACVYKIAQKTASIEFELYRITNRAGDKVEVFVHEALDLLYKPNPYQTKEEFFQLSIINKKLTGELFILKVRDDSGNVLELWNLRPDFVRIVMTKEGTIKHYEFNGPNGVVNFIPEDVIHDSYPDPLSSFLGGVSPLAPAVCRVDVEEYATNYQKNFFVNNARPDFILTSEKKVQPEQKDEIREAWDARHKGNKNTGKGAILEGGLTYQQVSISQREMDYIESLKMTRDDILVAFQVPKPIVAITDDVNLANAKTAMEIFLSETIEPEIKQLCTKLNEHLIYPEFGDNFYIGYENPVPEDEVARADIQTKRIQSGTLLINEAREQWGDEPVVGGNTLYLPIGLIGVGGLPNSKGKVSRSLESRLPDVRQRVFRGRSRAAAYLELHDKVKGMLLAKVVKDAQDAEKPKKMPLIRAEVRGKYVDMVLKGIDARGDTMEEPLNKFASAQHARFVKAIKLNEKEFTTKIRDDWKKAAKNWSKQEQDLMAAFALPFIDDFLKSAAKDAMETVAPAETFDDTVKRVQDYIKQRAKDLGKSATATTLDDLVSTLSAGIAANESIVELQNRVEDVYAFYPQFRSRMIARTEATSANNKGFIEAYHQSGVANAKEWIATNDDRTRDSHITTDGDIVKLEEKFSNGLMFPGDPNGAADEVINCRCVLGPAFAE